MLNPWASGTVYGFEALIFYIFFSRVSVKKLAGWKCVAVGLGLFELGALLNLLLSNSVVANTALIICIITAYGKLCFRMPLKAAFFYGLILDGLNFAMELVTIFVFSMVIRVPATAYKENLYVLFIEALTCKSSYFITCLLLTNFVYKSKIQQIPVSLFVYPICVSICLIAFSYLCFAEIVDERGCLLLAGVSALLLVSLLFLFHTFQEEAEKEALLGKARSENAHLKIEKEYYDILEQQNRNLMVYAHDARKHLIAIRELSQDSQIIQYVDRLYGSLSDYTKACRSGNKLLDVMVSRYVMDSERKGISFTYNVKECPLLCLEDLDLVTVLGNLMDNAFTSASLSREKQVCLTTSLRNGYNVIVLKNSCDIAPIAHGEKLLSTKESPCFHGYGLESVSRTVKKYQGDQYWSYDSGRCVFTMTVILRQK